MAESVPPSGSKDFASTFHCNGINSLPGGQITAAGLVSYGSTEEFRAEPYFFAITGGTGKYRTAHGEIKIQERSPTEAELTFRIIL